MLNDLRFAVRVLLRSPGFTSAALLVLTLGISATTTMFGAINAVLLEPLPFPDPDKLFVVRETRPQAGFERTVVSAEEYLTWTRGSRVIENAAIHSAPGVAIAINGATDRLPALRVSAEFFPLLGLTPIAGRPFTRESEQPGHGDVLLISYRLWQDRFGGAADVVGRTVRLESRPAVILGVLPPKFSFGGRVDVVVPETLTPELAAASQQGHSYDIYARLAPGVTREQAIAELTRTALAAEHSPKHLLGVTLVPLKDEVVGDARTPMLVLFAAVGCVLLIACANIANLLLARGTARQREIAIRSALGAGRPRIVRQLVTESLLLSFVGGIAGALLATWLTDVLARAAASSIPRADEIHVDVRALLFAMGISLAAGLLFGLIPALHASRSDVTLALKQEGRGSSGARQRALSVFVVAEIALALVLLVGAGLLLASFDRLRHVDPGFDAGPVLVAPAFLPEWKYSTRETLRAFFTRADAELSAVPGVVAVGATNALPLSGDNSSGALTIEGQPAPTPATRPNADRRAVTPGYFAALSMHVLAGRVFTAADDDRAPLVVMVSRGFADRYWPGQDAIGRRLKLGRYESAGPMRTVIGVVNNVQHANLSIQPRPVIYYPYTQGPDAAMQWVIRSTSNPAAIAGGVRQAMQRLDPDLPTTELKPLTDFVQGSLMDTEIAMSLLGSFALLAILLAAAGVYGVMAYAVAQRTTEFGIRVALGAAPRDLVRLVGRQAMALTAAGVIIGLAAARLASAALTGMVYGVRPSDPTVYLSTAGILAAVALSACIVPALRALRVDPIVALKAQ
jgi:putative ABC transport system permease protein